MTRLFINLLALTTVLVLAIRAYDPRSAAAAPRSAAAAPRSVLPPCPYFCGDSGLQFPNHAACLAACPTFCALGLTPFACQP